jgi:predicted nucleotidyltransferase
MPGLGWDEFVLASHAVFSELQAAKVLEVLGERFGAEAVWLFGSQATGRATANSDIDLAVLFAKRPSAAERIELQATLAERLGHSVDLVDLDAASPALAMQVLKHGKLLVDRNPRRRIAFTAVLPSRYEDLRRLRAPIERMIAQRMSHGGA